MKPGPSPMKHAIVLAALLAAGPALAVNIVLKEGTSDGPEEQPATRPATIDLRHTQVIRCVDAKGNLILQGGPCLPTAAAVAASAAPEVIELSVKERETVNVPVWAGVGAIVVGGLLLAFGGRPK